MDVNSVKERLRNIGPKHGLMMLGVGFLVSLMGLAIMLVAGLLSKIPVLGSLLMIIAQIGYSLIMACAAPLMVDYMLSVCSGNEVGLIDCIKSLVMNANNYLFSIFYAIRATWWRCIVGSIIPTIVVMIFASKALINGKLGLFFVLFTVLYVGVIVALFALCYKFMYITIAKLYDNSLNYHQCRSLSVELTSVGLPTMLQSYFKAYGINLLLMLVPFVNILIAYPKMAAVPILFFLDGVGGVDMSSMASTGSNTERAPRRERQQRRNNQPAVAEVSQPVEEPSKPEEHVDTMLDDMIRAIQGAYVTKITYNGDTRIALPIDVVIGKDGITKYNFFVKDGAAVKPIQIKASSIESLLVLNKRFDPAQYVDWEPHWNVPREWNL